MTQRILFLFLKDARLELRSKTALTTLFMYALASVFSIYMAIGEPENEWVWNALFWISMIYCSVHSVMRLFYNETHSMRLYYYQIADPHEIIFSKLLYGLVFNTLLWLVTFGAFALFLGSMVQNYPLFILVSLLSIWGMSSILTLISAIAAQTNNAAGILPVLAFPVLLPLFLSAINATMSALSGDSLSSQLPNLIVLSLFNIVSWLLSYLLFPYLWRN